LVRLRHATAEGRLTAQELEDRLEALFKSRTYGEIDALLADLPVTPPSSPVGAEVVRWAGAIGAVTLAVAMLGMLALIRVRSAFAVAGGPPDHPGPPRHFRFPPQFVDPHQLAILATSMVAVVAVMSAVAALVWVLVRSRASSVL
jgi:hypothetical protein